MVARKAHNLKTLFESADRNEEILWQGVCFSNFSKITILGNVCVERRKGKPSSDCSVDVLGMIRVGSCKYSPRS